MLKVNDSNKMFGSLEESGEDSFVKKPNENQPFLDELSELFHVEEVPEPVLRHQGSAIEHQQQSTLILDEEEVGAAQFNALNNNFLQDYSDPNIENMEGENGKEESILPSFDASGILPNQNDASQLQPKEHSILFEPADELRQTYKEDFNNESADFNFSKSDNPAIARISALSAIKRKQRVEEEMSPFGAVAKKFY